MKILKMIFFFFWCQSKTNSHCLASATKCLVNTTLILWYYFTCILHTFLKWDIILDLIINVIADKVDKCILIMKGFLWSWKMRSFVSFLFLLFSTADINRPQVGGEEAFPSLMSRWVSCPLSDPYRWKA